MEIVSTPLEQLLDQPSVSISILLQSFSHSLPNLSRSTFDRFFDSLSRPQSNASAHLRQVKSIIETERGWKLNRFQLRMVLKANLQREKEHRIKRLIVEREGSRRNGEGRGEESAPEPTKEEQKAIWAQRKRQNISDALLKEYLPLVSNSRKVPKSEHQAVEEVLELFALCAAIRPSSTTRDQDAQALLAFSRALDFSKWSQSCVVIEDDIAEVIKRMFRNGRDEEAISILRKMAEKGRVLTVRVMREIVRDYYEERDAVIKVTSTQSRPSDSTLLTQFDQPSRTSRSKIDLSDEYSHAREVLDQVCTSTSSAALDELLRLRLERVDRSEELERNPRGAFLKWLNTKGSDRPEWIETTLRIWEAGVEKGEDGEDLVASSYRKVLEELVLKACQVGKITEENIRTPVLRSSPLIDYAVELAIHHFPLQVLIHHSHALLPALTVDSHSPDLACYLFDTLNSPPIDFPFARFQWSANLLPSFTRLFFSSHRYERDLSLPIRLYLSWTSSGLTFPAGLWDPLWRSLGQTGTIDDLERVLQDWEETGRGQATSRIVRQVLQGAINSGNVPRSLELFHFFRSRYAPSSLESTPTFQRMHLSPLVVPIESYNALFTLLAQSRTDHRKILSTLLSSLIFDGHSPSTEIYNALLASNLHRSSFKISDVDSAGVIYNKMVQTGLKPDRDTFGMLMHGFNRMALEGGGGGGKGGKESNYRSIGIEASLRTFRASLANLDSGTMSEGKSRNKRQDKAETEIQTLARGQSVGALMKILAGEGRFEDAKEIGEEWWRALVKVEEIVGSKDFWEGRSIKDECAEMKKALTQVGNLERESLQKEGVEK